MAAFVDAHLVELRRLQLALTEISTLLEAIQRRPQVMLRHAADELEGATTTPKISDEGKYVRHFAFAITNHRMHGRPGLE